ncbi:MAG: hypothetical protein AAFO94_04680, partial [Bacteroidota bacterium]
RNLPADRKYQKSHGLEQRSEKSFLALFIQLRLSDSGKILIGVKNPLVPNSVYAFRQMKTEIIMTLRNKVAPSTEHRAPSTEHRAPST